MKNLKIKRMIIVLLVGIVMLSVSTKVLATDELSDPLQINILTNEEQTPTTPTEPTTPSQGQETLPQTGDASDYAIFLIISLFAVVSVYAYKKVRDYNRI